MHIKTIKGRKYYYQSIRIGKKVTSKYLGPVDEKVKYKKTKKVCEQDLEMPEDSYIG